MSASWYWTPPSPKPCIVAFPLPLWNSLSELCVPGCTQMLCPGLQSSSCPQIKLNSQPSSCASLLAVALTASCALPPPALYIPFPVYDTFTTCRSHNFLRYFACCLTPSTKTLAPPLRGRSFICVFTAGCPAPKVSLGLSTWLFVNVCEKKLFGFPQGPANVSCHAADNKHSHGLCGN